MASLMYIASSKTCLNENTGLGPLVPVHRTSPAPWLPSRRKPSADVLSEDSIFRRWKNLCFELVHVLCLSLSFSDTIYWKDVLSWTWRRSFFFFCVLGSWVQYPRRQTSKSPNWAREPRAAACQCGNGGTMCLWTWFPGLWSLYSHLLDEYCVRHGDSAVELGKAC